MFVLKALQITLIKKLSDLCIPAPYKSAGRYTHENARRAHTCAGRRVRVGEKAPITVSSPMVTPGSITAPPTIHTFLPILTGAEMVVQNSKEPSSFFRPAFGRLLWGERRCISAHWGNQTAVAYLYDVVIQKGAVHIHFTAVAEMDIFAVIHIKRGSYPQICPAAAQQAGQNFILCGQVCRRGKVVLSYQVFCQVPRSSSRLSEQS